MCFNRTSNHGYRMKKIVCFGEVVYDLFEDESKIGGAPLNVAIHLKNLISTNNSELEVSFFSSIGKDELGNQASESLKKWGLHKNLVVSEKKTGLVKVKQHEGRDHQFEIIEDCAWEEIETTPFKTDIFFFGSLALKSDFNKRQVSKWSQYSEIIVCDLNIREPFFDKETALFCLDHANVLKINETEIELLSEYFELVGSIDDQLRSLASLFSLSTIALTLGSEGAYIFQNADLFFEPAKLVQNFVDTVGAGDSFTACLCFGIANEIHQQDILKMGTTLACSICQIRGAIPDNFDSYSLLD